MKLNHVGISLNWTEDSQFLLLAAGPEVLQFTRPEVDDYLGADSTRDTFAIELQCRKYMPKIAYQAPDADSDWEDTPQEEGEEKRALVPPEREVTYPEDNISAVLPGSEEGNFFLTLASPDGDKYPGDRFETLYECSFTQEEPVQKIALNEVFFIYYYFDCLF